MKLIVDSNVLFTFFWETSFFRRVIRNEHFEWHAPRFALREIDKYAKDIQERAGVSKVRFTSLKGELKRSVRFAPLKTYSFRIREAARITPDKDDVDFFALALVLGCPIWSNDATLREQKEVLVVTTCDMALQIRI